MNTKNNKKSLFTDASGNIHFIKRIVVFLMGFYTYRRFNGFNQLNISGTKNLLPLTKTNVLFISNHQTYFADVIAMYHVFNSFKNGYIDSIKNPVYLLNPKLDFYYVAATETMKEGIIQRILSYTGAITIKRSWRAAGKDVSRGVDVGALDAIETALNNGWVVTFPQGTTKAFAPGRKGVAHMVKDLKPIVVPIVIDGFRRSFDKKGLLIKKTGIKQKIEFKSPLEIDYEKDSIDEILAKIMDSIEQSEKFMKVPELKALEENKENNSM